MVDEKSKSKFLIRNLGKGLIWLSVLLVVFVLLKDNEYIHNLEWLISVSKERWLVFFIFLTSEVVFGLIPPEFFMIWSLHHGFSDSYILNVFYLAIISYFAGVVGYFIGMTFARTQ
ncbi:MAG: hypothetical protein OEX02_17855, partial [Cyclobacteriaceae bacterium]|nr:hypothetical protein [Cyclobacteriaceae bacterium]